MEHNEASKSNAIERYILGEMSETERDSFEEHFFGCGECARDLHMTEIFRANAKAVFEDRAQLSIPMANTFWQRVSQPILSIAAAALLAVGSLSVYQNLVTIPRLNQIAETARTAQPIQFLAASPVTRGESPLAKVGPEFMDVAVAIPLDPGWDYQQYRVVFKPQCGAIAEEGPRELPPPERGLPLHLRVPTASLDSGACQLTLDGLSSGKWEKDLGAFSFRINKTEE